MKNSVMLVMAVLLLMSCNNTAETAHTPIASEDFQTVDLPRKIVQCVFTLNYDDISLDYNIANTSVFENRLGILSGFDLEVLSGTPQGADSSESNLSALYVASYADCDMSKAFVSLLAEKHLKFRNPLPIKKINDKTYIDLAKDIGFPLDEAAFVLQLPPT